MCSLLICMDMLLWILLRRFWRLEGVRFWFIPVFFVFSSVKIFDASQVLGSTVSFVQDRSHSLRAAIFPAASGRSLVFIPPHIWPHSKMSKFFVIACASCLPARVV